MQIEEQKNCVVILESTPLVETENTAQASERTRMMEHINMLFN